METKIENEYSVDEIESLPFIKSCKATRANLRSMVNKRRKEMKGTRGEARYNHKRELHKLRKLMFACDDRLAAIQKARPKTSKDATVKKNKK